MICCKTLACEKHILIKSSIIAKKKCSVLSFENPKYIWLPKESPIFLNYFGTNKKGKELLDHISKKVYFYTHFTQYNSIILAN